MVALISFSAYAHSATISGSKSVNLQDVRDQPAVSVKQFADCKESR